MQTRHTSPKKVSYRNNTVVLTEQPSQREDKVVA